MFYKEQVRMRDSTSAFHRYAVRAHELVKLFSRETRENNLT